LDAHSWSSWSRQLAGVRVPSALQRRDPAGEIRVKVKRLPILQEQPPACFGALV